MDTLRFNCTAQAHLRESVERIGTCLAMIDDSVLWEDPAPNLVSIGNLIQHLIGNVSQYILKGLAGGDYVRHREAEFRHKPSRTRHDLLAELQTTVDQACAVIEGLTDAQLDENYTIQGFAHSGTSAIMHVMEHFSYHAGQITYIVKLKTGRATDYYVGQDLNRD